MISGGYPMNQRGEMGVGTLIIFIALLLVAAVAAGVLIQTAGSLQQKALSTGTQATGQISTNAVTLEVSAVDGTTTLTNFSSVMKLAPGSDPIELDSVTLTFGTSDSTTTLTYLTPLNSSHYCSIGGTNYTRAQVDQCARTNGDEGNFTVSYLQQGTNHQEGVVVRGDVIRLYLSSPRTIAAGEDLRINFIPKTGTPTLTVFTVPDVISTQRVYLYP
jgi:archaellin